MRLKVLYVFLLILSIGSFTLISCSETKDEDTTYVDWQERNDAYFSAEYNAALTNIAAGNYSWKTFAKYSINNDIARNNPTQHIIVDVRDSVMSGSTPLLTDSVLVHIVGRLMPTVDSPEGIVFERTYLGSTFNANTASAQKRLVSAYNDGLATALQHMKVGEHWIVYVPYNLGYGSASSTGTVAPSTSVTIPAYSTLIYDVRLVGIRRGDGNKITTTYSPKISLIE